MLKTACLLVPAMLVASAARAEDARPSSFAHCFTADQYNGWRSPDRKTIYIRADLNRFYRIELSRECPALTHSDAQLILKQRTGAMICSAADIGLKAKSAIADLPEPCFVAAMTELSPDEIAALPKAVKP